MAHGKAPRDSGGDKEQEEEREGATSEAVEGGCHL